MESMKGRLEGYLEQKRLEINVAKTKIMRFRREGERMKKRKWRRRGEKIEEIKEYNYLGYKRMGGKRYT